MTGSGIYSINIRNGTGSDREKRCDMWKNGISYPSFAVRMTNEVRTYCVHFGSTGTRDTSKDTTRIVSALGSDIMFETST